jgi:hypothetical protein
VAETCRVGVVMIVALLTNLIHRHLFKDLQWDAEIQDMFLRLQPVTTFTFSCGHKVRST